MCFWTIASSFFTLREQASSPPSTMPSVRFKSIEVALYVFSKFLCFARNNLYFQVIFRSFRFKIAPLKELKNRYKICLTTQPIVKWNTGLLLCYSTWPVAGVIAESIKIISLSWKIAKPFVYIYIYINIFVSSLAVRMHSPVDKMQLKEMSCKQLDCTI